MSSRLGRAAYMLFLTNNDKPGVIGDVGTTLGKNDINIARMQFGREGEGGIAVSVVSIDSPASKEVRLRRYRNFQTSFQPNRSTYPGRIVTAYERSLN